LVLDEIDLYDSQGKLVYQSNSESVFTITLSTEKLPNGIYTLRLKSNNSTDVRKIVVAH